MIDLYDSTASLDLAMEVASYFELRIPRARQIAAEAGKAVSTWRAEASRLGITETEINRMSSAFEHQELAAALRLRT